MINFEKINEPDLQKYIKKMNDGDLEARTKVIRHYSNIIIKIIEKNFNKKSYDKEELFNAGLCGLLLALKRYSKHHPQTLNIMIFDYIHKEINDFISKDKSTSKEIIPYTQEPMEHVIDKELLESVFNEIDTLSKREKNILYLFFYQNYNPKDIGKIYNMSERGINQKLKIITEKIKEQIYRKNIIINQDNKVLESFKNYLEQTNEYEILEYIENEGIDKVIHSIFKHIKDRIKPFSEKRLNILYLFFFENYTINQISKTYNIKYPTIKKIIDECIFDIKNILFPYSLEGRENFSQFVANLYKR